MNFGQSGSDLKVLQSMHSARQGNIERPFAQAVRDGNGGDRDANSNFRGGRRFLRQFGGSGLSSGSCQSTHEPLFRKWTVSQH
jgi:hypothetical protein